ncbi:hypothetical protein CGLO_18230 [Colletotrichum gloeosporioides Cg-14]|uniref:Uncharacterized protein n=1 Tax=Colletotrichum gloeosporioides (strain Cg-14) TaxID=1237896 RepID=T0JUX2_COLGC|nr:hypothetical protein CGLO_18230 [Colletotrichum gloeosporioides Cg-14]
MIYVLENEIQL